MGRVVLPPCAGCLAWGDPALGSMGSMVGIVVTSKRTYINGPLPGLLLLVPPSPRGWLDPQAGKPGMGFRTFTTVGELLWYYCSPVCGSPTQQVKSRDLILLCLHPSYHLIAASLSLDLEYLFLVGTSIVLLVVVQQLVAILVLLQEKMSACPSTLPSSTPIFLPGKSHGQGSLVGYSSWNLKELGMTEHTCIIYLVSYSEYCKSNWVSTSQIKN